MANMFRETAKHKSPVSVEDSVKTDKVISELWSWCSGVETLGMILFVILIIIGIITSIIAGFEPDGTSYYGEVKYKFNFGTFFINLIDAAICAFIEYCIYHVVALLIGALASITQHTKATAKLLEYQLSKGEPVDVAENEWQCKNAEVLIPITPKPVRAEIQRLKTQTSVLTTQAVRDFAKTAEQN